LGRIVDGVNETGSPQTADGNSLGLPYSYIKECHKTILPNWTTYQNGFH
jgi:hypothetical protein